MTPPPPLPFIGSAVGQKCKVILLELKLSIYPPILHLLFYRYHYAHHRFPKWVFLPFGGRIVRKRVLTYVYIYINYFYYKKLIN